MKLLSCLIKVDEQKVVDIVDITDSPTPPFPPRLGINYKWAIKNKKLLTAEDPFQRGLI
jgi:hypothetical protein